MMKKQQTLVISFVLAVEGAAIWFMGYIAGIEVGKRKAWWEKKLYDSKCNVKKD